MKLFKLGFLNAVLLGLFVSLIGGCKPSKRTLVISTGQEGGTYHGAAESLRAVLAKKMPELTFKLLPSEGSVESMRRLATEGEPYDLALIQNDTKAIEDKVRTVLPLFEDVLHFIVPKGSEISGIRDLEGKQVAVGPPDSGTAKFVRQLFLHYGISMDELEPSSLPIGKAAAALEAGELDAVLIVAGFKPKAIESLFLEHGDAFRFVSLEQEPDEQGGPVEGFRINYPFASRFVIPQGVYRTKVSGSKLVPDFPIVTIAVRTVLACRKELPEDLVFRLTRGIIESRSELIHLHPASAHITDRMNEAELAFPLHAGASQYVRRNEPGFLVTYAEVMAFGLSLVVATVALLGAFRRWISMRKKDRIDRYYVRLNDLLVDLQTTPPADKLEAMQKEVSALRHQAFQELVDERLVANESFRIFQSLLSDCERQIHSFQQS